VASNPIPAVTHPAPERRKASLRALIFGLAAAPLAWSTQTIVGYGVASRACFPGDTPRSTPAFAYVWSAVLTVNVIALMVGLLGTLVAFMSWSATRQEHGGRPTYLMDVGEGRTRFHAMCGILVGAGFVVAILFTTLTVALASACR
jgi:hypothetical protein